MSRYNYDSDTWVFKCTKCGAGSAEGDFGPALKARQADPWNVTGLWCKICRGKSKEEEVSV